MDLQAALITAKSAAREARKVLLHYYGHLAKVREKGMEGLVSEADVESEKTIAAILRETFPEIPMLGEEGASARRMEHPGNHLDRRSARWNDELCPRIFYLLY